MSSPERSDSMEEELKSIIKQYIEDVNYVCSQLLDGLNLNTKADFWEYRQPHHQIEYEVGGTRYILHGRGCAAISDERFLDWNFGYGSRWCGIDPWLLARTLERSGNKRAAYYDSSRIEAECLRAVADGEMYEKYGLYYITIPDSETFKPEFPSDFDTLTVEHYGTIWVIPRNKMVDRFLRKSLRIYNNIAKSRNLYTLRFMLDGKEVYTIPYDDVGYPENAVKIMNELLAASPSD